MSGQLQEDKKQLKDIKTRKDFKAYLHLIKGTKTVAELVEKSGIQRDFLNRIIGVSDPPKIYVMAKNAYPLCKFVAPYEKKTAKEVLEILIDNGLLPQNIKPDRKMFEEDDQKENQKSDADITKIEENNQREIGEDNEGVLKNSEELTTCVRAIIENMHFKLKDKEWKYKSELKYQTVEVEKDSILLAGIETWESVQLAYLCADTSDEDFEQIYERLRTHGKDKKILLLILCKDCHAYKKACESIQILKSENSILLINLEKLNDVYILSMHKKHKKAFEYEKGFASYIEDGKQKGSIFWSYKP